MYTIIDGRKTVGQDISSGYVWIYLIVRFGEQNGAIIFFRGGGGCLSALLYKAEVIQFNFILYILGSWTGAFHIVIDQDDPAWGTTWGILKVAL